MKIILALVGFAVTYWFYAQLAALARTGPPAPQISPFTAFQQVTRTGPAWMKSRRSSVQSAPA